ncbi:endonuclease/exonuclease/phosphatase family protein [Haloglycomyces albus]|uniref:endonuclease/exonuclease/phosphatase family protein n=1 Tax=Haloglycomyces albus TaxID=526067 RepID=UPI00046CF71C|nr:endonuclease/exonuclease/phosphatase family protein [Haloglycomyces albus]
MQIDSETTSDPVEPTRRQRIVRLLCWAASVGAGIFLFLRLFGLEFGYPLIGLIAYTPWVAAALLIVAVGQLLLRARLPALCSAIAGVVLLSLLVPRMVPSDQREVTGAEVTIMSVNAYVGSADMDAVFTLVERHQPDVLCVQELTNEVHRVVNTRDDWDFEHGFVAPNDTNAAGAGCYSQLSATETNAFDGDSLFHQNEFEVRIDDDVAFRFANIHTAAPVSSERVSMWRDDFAGIPRPEGDVPWILAGDFNATVDHGVLRGLLDDGYQDAASLMGDGLTATWRMPGYFDGNLRAPGLVLDHVLVDESIRVEDFQVLNDVGSDHRPILATLTVPST